ncbi:MAG: NAD+ synthase [Bacteroidetes bacterium]|nr:NAD+ synthase [Bacteroidota bacterium]MCY4206232.1 NAD+ synthase [Bacteroidota bacterium]
MKLALAQINTLVGDLRGNADKVLQYCQKAHSKGADLVVFPELTLPGYPPLDLLEYRHFVASEQELRQELATQIPDDLGLLIGGLAPNSGPGKPLFNAAYLYENGQCVGVRHKQLLPTYDIFDERRYFAPETAPTTLRWRGLNLGIHICEDLWNVRDLDPKPYADDPVSTLARQSPDVFINLCASPFAIDKHHERRELMQTVIHQYERPYVFVNLVGANTDVIFDGRSCVIRDGVILEAPAFEEALLIWDLKHPPTSGSVSSTPMEQVLGALTVGIRDYVSKSRLQKKAYIGLSGGIDSAVTAAVAVHALGPDNVIGVAMPSIFSSEGSVRDAHSLASNLGIELHTIPILELVNSFDSTLKKLFEHTYRDTTEENIQARIRGTLLMALTNKFGGIVLATGNKSELAMGYATLYGDMNGALAVLGDLYKTEVYELAHLLNQSRTVIPESSITKEPSAELSPDQKDLDTLPPYPILDKILRLYLEEQKSPAEIAEHFGDDEDLVRSIIYKVDRNEFKRQQAAPILRLRKNAFGSGRRKPVVTHL